MPPPGLRVLIDWVPNHTSTEHGWFQALPLSRTDPKRDWYIWRDPGPDGGLPNNWISDFGSPTAWQLDPTTGQYYLHLFLPEQADLIWRNPEVVAAMHDTLRFWLDRGVDGFRMDVVQSLLKRADFADIEDPNEILFGDAHLDTRHPRAAARHPAADRRLPGDRVAVGETSVLSTAKMATYYGHDDELHLCFNFPQLLAPWARQWRRRIERTYEELDPDRGWPTWVLSNHDVPRHRSRYGGSEAAARAAVMALTLARHPLPLRGRGAGPARCGHPARAQARPDRSRRMPGADALDAGRAPRVGSGRTLAAVPARVDSRSVAAQRQDPTSILHLYRRLLAHRHDSPALRLGEVTVLDGWPEAVLAWDRRHGQDRRRVVVSFLPDAVTLPEAVVASGLDGGGWQVALASDGVGEGQAFDGRLGPGQAVILRPDRAW